MPPRSPLKARLALVDGVRSLHRESLGAVTGFDITSILDFKPPRFICPPPAEH